MPASNKTIDQIFFFLLLSFVTLAFFNIVSGFFQAIFWAVVLALMFWPLHRKLMEWIPRFPSLNAVLVSLAAVFTVLIPVLLIALAVGREAVSLANDIQEGNISLETALSWLEERLPFLSGLLERFDLDLERIQELLSSAAVASGQWIAGQAVNIGQSTLQFFLQMFVMLYLLFFFVRDGRRTLQSIGRILPFDYGLQQRVNSRFVVVARATIKGTFVISAIQGLIGGLIFWALDIRAAVLWGVVMGVLALIPAVGPALVWIPAAIVLFATGEVVKAVILIFVGAVIIGLIDNVLRPILVGRDTRLPDYIILLTTLGGIAAFGLSGIMIGPIIAALFITVWQSFGDRQRSEEKAAEPTGPTLHKHP